VAETQDNAVPRWARELAPGVWQQICEMVDDGFDAARIMLIADVPESKRRSLQVYVAKYGPRRRLVRFSEFKDALANYGPQFGEDLVKAMSIIARHTVSPDTDPDQVRKAIEVMSEVAKLYAKLTDQDEKVERERERTEIVRKAIDRTAVVDEVYRIYGVEKAAKGETT